MASKKIYHLTTSILRSSSSHLHRSISSSTYSKLDPFAAFDQANRKTGITHSTDPSKFSNTSSPLPSTSNRQSDAIESHPSTSVDDLHPLPLSTSIPDALGQQASVGEQEADMGDVAVNWSRSFSGLSQQPFDQKAVDILMAPLDPADVEIKPDGVIYLPEIKYRRILNKAFGPGGWGLAPRGSSYVTSKNVSREYALICLGRLVSLARGEQDYFNGADNIPTATEGCKSNALMRCCKDLGIASELWDPNYVQWWKSNYASVEYLSGLGLSSAKKKAVWKKKKLEEWSPNLRKP